MPGRTGKRARPPAPCAKCGKGLRGQSFFRIKKVDYCTSCGEDRIREDIAKREAALGAKAKGGAHGS